MRAKKLPASVPFEPILLTHLKKADKKNLVKYLNACLGDGGDGDLEAFFQGLHDIAKAKGIKELADETKIARDTLYKMFNSKNPTIETFRGFLRGLGMDIGIIEIKRA